MRIAFLYPGQGSHRPGMAAAWQGDPVFERVTAAAGFDVAAAADDPDACSRTAVGQPAIFATSLAADRALRRAGLVPDLVAGHSLGEVTAAVAAGALTLDDGAGLVCERGRAMGRACEDTPGAMAVVLGLDGDTIADALRAIPGVGIANHNGATQAVVSGTNQGIAAATEALRAAGGRVRALDVEGAFHSPAMTSAMVAVDTLLRRTPVRDPEVPVVTGTDGSVLRRGSAVARALTEGILAPVRWTAVMQRLGQADLVVEVGPGGVLSGLARRALTDPQVVAVAAPADVSAALECAAGGVAAA